MDRSARTETVLAGLDVGTAARARKALAELRRASGRRTPTRADVEGYLRASLARSDLPRVERHEVLWALGDYFDAAGRPELAALCRDRRTHQELARARPPERRRARAQAWGRTLHRGTGTFWDEVADVLEDEPELPDRLGLALTPVRALLEAVGEGLLLTDAGYLPPVTALVLDTRFGWSDEHAVVRPRGESDLPPLVFLREHLTAQGLLEMDGRALRAPGVLLADEALWRATVGPGSRWGTRFERDVLATMALTLLRPGELTRNQLRDEVSYLLTEKWRSTGAHTLDEGVRATELGWFRVGLTLGWWNREGGPWSARVALSGFGRAAASATFWTVATR